MSTRGSGQEDMLSQCLPEYRGRSASIRQMLFLSLYHSLIGETGQKMSKGGNIKQWNVGQETIAQGDRDLGLEDLKEGRKGPVTVVAKEEQG